MFPTMPRPPRVQRKKIDDAHEWEIELEQDLIQTKDTGLAIVVSLEQFHSSPIKGRLWHKGYSVRHRRIGGNVAAWVE